MTPALLLIAVGLCLALIYMIKHVYVFQIKEYRFDRVRARIQDLGILHLLYGPDIQTPSKRHPRNIAILSVGMVCITIVSLLIPQTAVYGVALIVLAPVIAFAITAGAVLLTSIPVWIYRRRIVARASDILAYVQPTVIGITGSYGKSTTKDYLYAILASRFETVKTDRNQNTDVGVALSAVRHLKKGVRYFVVEMGAYRRGEIAHIVKFTHPSIAVITALGTQHLALFGSKERLFQAKSEIALSLPPDGRLFVASSIDRMYRLRLTKLAPCPVEEYESVPHDPHTSALHAAQAVARYLGISEEEITRAVERMEKPATITPHTHPRGYEYIDSSYSSNVDGFISHVHLLKSLRKRNKIVLTSGIIELGGYRGEAYRRILSEMPSHVVVYTTDRTLSSEAARSRKASQVVYHKSSYGLFDHVCRLLDSDTAILIEGKFRQDFVDRIIS